MKTWACTALLALAFAAHAREPAKPEYAVLKAMEGTWDLTSTIGGREAKGSVTYKMELGGLWLAGSHSYDGAFSGRSLDTYDPDTKRYVSVWVDSASTRPSVSEGTYDATKRTFTKTWEAPGADGKTAKFRSVFEVPDANTMRFTTFRGDEKEPLVTIQFKRRK